MFAQWLQDQLDQRKWKQVDLAKAAELDRAVIHNLLKSKRGPGETTIKAIAKALNLPPEEVYRVANFLPPIAQVTERDERINHRIKMLSDEKRRQVEYFLDYLESWPEPNENAVLTENKKVVSVPERIA